MPAYGTNCGTSARLSIHVLLMWWHSDLTLSSAEEIQDVSAESRLEKDVMLS